MLSKGDINEKRVCIWYSSTYQLPELQRVDETRSKGRRVHNKRKAANIYIAIYMLFLWKDYDLYEYLQGKNGEMDDVTSYVEEVRQVKCNNFLGGKMKT